jgi:hypothetical protein
LAATIQESSRTLSASEQFICRQANSERLVASSFLEINLVRLVGGRSINLLLLEALFDSLWNQVRDLVRRREFLLKTFAFPAGKLAT